MKYIVLGSLLLTSMGYCGEDIKDEAWQSSFTVLEAQQKNLESLIAKASQDQDSLKREISALTEMKGEIANYKQIVSELTAQNHDLLAKIQEKEGKELLLKSTLVKMDSLIEKMQGEISQLDQREIQQKSKYQSLNARVDNLTQQIEEVHRKVSQIKGKK